MASAYKSADYVTFPTLIALALRAKVTKVDALADIYAPISGPVFS